MRFDGYSEWKLLLCKNFKIGVCFDILVIPMNSSNRIYNSNSGEEEIAKEIQKLDYIDIEVYIIFYTEEEDKFMYSFGLWFMSPDGRLKSIRWANQHDNVIMSIFYKKFERLGIFLWRRKQETMKKIYLGSIKQFLIIR